MGNQRLLVHLDTRSSNQIDRKMSWQSYVDEQLIASGMVTAAAIAGHDGNIWAKSNGFNASPDEVLLCICVYLAYNNCLLALSKKKLGEEVAQQLGTKLGDGRSHCERLQVHVPVIKREGGEGKERQLWCPHLQDKSGCHYCMLQRADRCRTVCRDN